MTLDERVNFFYLKLCEELGVDPDKQLIGDVRAFKDMIYDWQVNEAFHKIRNDYWNKKFDVPDYNKADNE